MRDLYNNRPTDFAKLGHSSARFLCGDVVRALNLHQNLRYLCRMYTRSWLVVKDDGRRTFEAVTANLTENAFTNKVYAMQRDGLNVSYVLLPVINRQASRESIRVTGYQYEEGLYDRLLKQHQDLLLRQADDFE